MNPEQLLIPRYKVIADYPGSKFTVGQIIEFTRRADKEFSVTEEWFVVLDCFAFGETWFKEYPHLFEPLQWWQDRKPEDLTGYIKIMVGDVWHVFKINIQDKNIMIWKFGMLSYKEFLPATEQEYLTYINNK